ncbi:hypothetical protein LL270_09045 [Pseudomonas aestusnigri]|uniref:hypothetical protein n=1 Tax=Halopseudomonas aestusnigri TaxID=857252 RepID=UPI001D1986C6|nr:hypothetical protein [Halopseudomonas aestusnigri]MCC4260801.1 hypothetical protein [Halopseudomonas aestusnigri]
MAAFQINDEEWGAFDGEPGDLFKAYCAIRRVMDYRTGVAGRVRRISEQMLSETLYVAPLRGRHESGSPTRQRVRSVIARLQALGLLVSIGPMVFELPLATRIGPSKSSATNEQPDQQPDQQPINSQDEASSNAASSGPCSGSATGSESRDSLNSNLPQGSGKPKPIPPSSPLGGKATTKPTRKTRLPDPFNVTHLMREWASERAPAVDLVFETEKFVNYWRGTGGTKADWVATWRTWMLKAQEDANRRPTKHHPAIDPDSTDWIHNNAGEL